MKFALCVVLGAVATTSTYANYDESGSIVCPSLCTDIYAPICGSDGETYSNECYLRLAACESQEHITQMHEGQCDAETSSTYSSGSGCPTVCTLIFKPVCGSDGVTYGNDCLLEVAQCQSGGEITKASEGECPPSGSESGCSDVCIEIFRPVCGSDGVTYPNSCFLGIASCNDPSITLAHTGACEGTSLSSEGSGETGNPSGSSACPDTCIEILRPVCGSDGVTYANSCFLDVASCNDPSITLVHNGPCEGTSLSSEGSNSSSQESTPSCPDVCPAIYAPVCGSDGVTYSNECRLEVASCNHPELCLKKASDGACAPVECKMY